MCEDGLSTPIPAATYKFLKWLGVDVYVAKATGTYFVMPKWTGGMRPGRTTMDIYKLFDARELADMDVETVKKRTEEALLFDAYREQEQMQVTYKHNDDLQGLENVLYMCPIVKVNLPSVCVIKVPLSAATAAMSRLVTAMVSYITKRGLVLRFAMYPTGAG